MYNEIGRATGFCVRCVDCSVRPRRGQEACDQKANMLMITGYELRQACGSKNG